MARTPATFDIDERFFGVLLSFTVCVLCRRDLEAVMMLTWVSSILVAVSIAFLIALVSTWNEDA